MAFLLLTSFAFHATSFHHPHPYDHEDNNQTSQNHHPEVHTASLIHAEDKKWWVQWQFIQNSFALPDDTTAEFPDIWQQSFAVSIDYEIKLLGSCLTDPITFYISKGILEYRDYA